MSNRLDEAFGGAPRARFLTDDQRRYVDEDRPLPIGHRQTNSQPSTVRRMLELLEVREGDRVLDVGSGSGWTTALLGRLVGASGEVWGVERVPELANWGARNVAALDLPWVHLVVADPGVLGLPGQAPYDRILVSAESRRLPEELVSQLADGGRMVVPVWGRLSVVDKDRAGDVTEHRVGHYAFVPLRRD